MQSNLTPRYLIIGVILAWAIYALLPTWQYQNMTDDEKEELRTAGELEQIESRKIVKNTYANRKHYLQKEFWVKRDL